MTFIFAWWWCFGLLPLPWLVRLLPPSTIPSTSVFYPFSSSVLQQKHVPSISLSKIFASIGWFCLICALARPQIMSDVQTASQESRNIVLAVDISESMLETDMIVAGKRTTRIEALKTALEDFIAKRHGDQIGMIVFADNAYVQSPLTYDTQSITQLVKKLRVGLAGKKTAIGDALVLAVKIIDNNPLANKNNASIIFLSDGKNTWGKVQPNQAISLVSDSGYTVYTIGFGGRGFANGLDEQTLRNIAQFSGGRYFRATNTNELIEVYTLLDTFTSVEIKTWQYRQQKELYWWLLLLALGCAVLCATCYIYIEPRTTPT